MPSSISKECPGCGRVSTVPKTLYKMVRRVFGGSRCPCGHERRWESPWSRREKKKRKPRICDCGCGHSGPCVFPKMKAVPDQPIKCKTPDCMSEASVEFQNRLMDIAER